LPLELERLEVMQEALVLTNEDLAFNQDETRDYFRTIRKIPLTPEQLERVYSATEGWAGGLILFSESLSRLDGEAREHYISETLPPRFKREVFQYFANEILASQPQSDQEFLLRSCIVDIVEPGFVKDLLGIENAEAILREHVRKNLFVQCFHDEQKGWLFRYHQIFRNFLKAKFDSEISGEEKRSLLLKAASLCERRNEFEVSLKYLLDAKAYPQAATIIERLGTDLLRQGRRQDLSRWIKALPEEIVEEDPWLLFYRARIRRYRAGRENVVSLQKALKIFNQRGNTRGILLSLAQLMTMSVSTGHHVIPLKQLLRDAKHGFKNPTWKSTPTRRPCSIMCRVCSYDGRRRCSEGDLVLPECVSLLPLGSLASGLRSRLRHVRSHLRWRVLLCTRKPGKTPKVDRAECTLSFML
jgi:ATP/maltotriose-dependent transcriptional regulator MalT